MLNVWLVVMLSLAPVVATGRDARRTVDFVVTSAAVESPQIFTVRSLVPPGEDTPIGNARVTIVHRGRTYRLRTSAEGEGRIVLRRCSQGDSISMEVAHPEFYGLELDDLPLSSDEDADAILVRLPRGSQACPAPLTLRTH